MSKKLAVAVALIIVAMTTAFMVQPAGAAGSVTTEIYTVDTDQLVSGVGGSQAFTSQVDGGTVAPSIPYTSTLAQLAAQNDGYVNLYAVIDDGVYAKQWYFSLMWTGSGWTNGTTPAFPDSFDLTDGVPLAGAGAAKPNLGCSVYKSWNADGYETVGETHTAASMNETMTYGHTADSDMGVGVNATGAGWKVSGTVHIGNSNGAAVSWTTSADRGRREKSSFHYVKQQLVGYKCPKYIIKATQWNGGAIHGGDDSYLDYHCNDPGYYQVKFANGTTFTRDTNDYVTFGAEVSIFGVGLTSQSGASTWVKMHWNMRADNRVLCGDTNFPTYSKRIFAGT